MTGTDPTADNLLPVHAGAAAFLEQVFAIVAVEIRKVTRDPIELFSRVAQPILWLAVFGQVFSRIKGIPTGNINYMAFMAPGILAQSVLFSAIFYGISVIWERDLGIVQKLLVSPSYREALVSGKAASAGIRGLAQMVLIYILIWAMRIRLNYGAASFLGVVTAVFLGSAVFSTFSLVVACIVKTRERFMGIGQLLTMPMFFASNAIYPVSLMPAWLRVVAHFNPLTYLVDALRQLMVQGGQSSYGLWTDFGVLAAVFLVLLLTASRLYPGIAR
jgi:ABC-2 type transport system permease protein